MQPQSEHGPASCSRVWLLGRSIVVGIMYLMAILTIHVQAADVPIVAASSSSTSSDFMTFAQRLQHGPHGLTFMDLLLFATVVMIGFEIMSYLALHTGEWIAAKRIPVRGKHLDDLTMVSSERDCDVQ